jgi:hypothetical protein
MEVKMPRKKKSKSADPVAIAAYMHKVFKLGTTSAKQEMIANLMMLDEVEFLEKIKTTIGEAEYDRLVSPC